MALERLKSCRNATELAAELGIHRTQLYKWRDQMEPIEDGPGPAANSRERELRKELRELKRVLGEKALEIDFFKGALQKVEARRQNSSNAGARRLRAGPRVDAYARQSEYRADVVESNYSRRLNLFEMADGPRQRE